jgi:hypothetical protein
MYIQMPFSAEESHYNVGAETGSYALRDQQLHTAMRLPTIQIQLSLKCTYNYLAPVPCPGD